MASAKRDNSRRMLRLDKGFEVPAARRYVANAARASFCNDIAEKYGRKTFQSLRDAAQRRPILDRKGCWPEIGQLQSRVKNSALNLNNRFCDFSIFQREKTC